MWESQTGWVSRSGREYSRWRCVLLTAGIGLIVIVGTAEVISAVDGGGGLSIGAEFDLGSEQAGINKISPAIDR